MAIKPTNPAAAGINKRTYLLTQFSILLAIETIVCFTRLGSLPAIGPIVATLGAVPVVITAILLGTGAGAAMGFIAGIFSVIYWTFMPPTPLAFVFTPFYSVGEVTGNFWSLVISIVPRTMIGVTTGLCFKALSKLPAGGKKDIIRFAVSGCAGSLANTFLVLGGIYVFFGKDYAEVAGVAFNLLLGVIGTVVLTSGIPEAVIAAVAAYFICRPVLKYMSL